MQTQELLNAWKVSDFSSFIVLDTPEKHIEDFLKSNYATQMFSKEFAGCIVRTVKLILE